MGPDDPGLPAGPESDRVPGEPLIIESRSLIIIYYPPLAAFQLSPHQRLRHRMHFEKV